MTKILIHKYVQSKDLRRFIRVILSLKLLRNGLVNLFYYFKEKVKKVEHLLYAHIIKPSYSFWELAGENFLDLEPAKARRFRERFPDIDKLKDQR